MSIYQEYLNTREAIEKLQVLLKANEEQCIAELKESSSVIEICSTWFTSANKGEIIIINPDNAPFRFEFEFKNPDIIEQTAIQDNKVVNKIILKRIEN